MFKVEVGYSGNYNWLDANGPKTIPVKVTFGEDKVVSFHFQESDYSREDLLDYSWPDMAHMVVAEVDRYFVHHAKLAGKELAERLHDDPDDEFLEEMEEAEQVYRVEAARRAINKATAYLTRANAAQLLSELAAK